MFSGDHETLTYYIDEPNLLDFYKDLITNTTKRILIYNEDIDPLLNSLTA